MQITINYDYAEGSTPVWIILASQNDCDEWNEGEGLREENDDTLYTPGYYWAVCFPGCIPDSDFYGPFNNEESAREAAEEQLNY